MVCKIVNKQHDGPSPSQGERVQSVFYQPLSRGCNEVSLDLSAYQKRVFCHHHGRRRYMSLFDRQMCCLCRALPENKRQHTAEHNTSAFNLWKYKMKSCTIYVQAYLYKTNCIHYWDYDIVRNINLALSLYPQVNVLKKKKKSQTRPNVSQPHRNWQTRKSVPQ